MKAPVLVALLTGTCLAAVPRLDREQLEAFVTGAVVTAMEDHRIPGVVISVIQGGEIILEKGYGFAREPERVRADPQTSLFRIASISKTFNATALLQLVEQGKVDLEADFTRYLPGIPFRLPLGVVRVRDLITHSAGFEDGYLGYFWAVDAASDLSLEDLVRRFQPAQVRPPGQRLVYSNYGTAVIGLIIQRVSGQSYPEYLQQHVLAPLGMTRSGFRDSRTPKGEPDLAYSYTWTGGRFRRPEWAWMHAGMQPAGGMIATAHEMTRYMRMHLGHGPIVLKPETLARMHTPLLGNHPFIHPNAHGFWVGDAWGYRTLQHGGSIFGFMSSLVLVPELDLGIFISTNASAGSRLSGTLPRRIVGHFFPKRLEIPAANPKADLAAYTGRYRAMRRSYTTLEKLNQLNRAVVISTNDQGYLAVTSGGITSRYVPLGEDRFLNADSGLRLAFSRDARGRPAVAHYDTDNLERIGPLEDAAFAQTMAGLLVFAMICRLLALWLYRRETPAETGGERLARLATAVVIPIWAVAAYASYVDGNAAEGLTSRHMAHYPTSWAWVWVLGGVTAAILTALQVFGLIPVWFRRSWTLPRRLAYTAYVALGVTMVGLMHYWNLLGLRMLG